MAYPRVWSAALATEEEVDASGAATAREVEEEVRRAADIVEERIGGEGREGRSVNAEGCSLRA